MVRGALPLHGHTHGRLPCANHLLSLKMGRQMVGWVEKGSMAPPAQLLRVLDLRAPQTIARSGSKRHRRWSHRQFR